MAFASRQLRALGTTATVAVDDPAAADDAAAAVAACLDAVDVACSRFRPDSEVWDLARAGGRPLVVSDLLFEAVTVALDAAATTGGAVDPTVGAALCALGYDRDFADIPPDAPGPPRPVPVPGFWTVGCDPDTQTVTVPAGLVLDLGATAKALAADLAAAAAAAATDASALVGIGGDVAVAGTPVDGGWPVGVAVDSSSPAAASDVVVALHNGGLASSSTRVRTWRRGGETRHHIVDPTTGLPAPTCWALVSVAAPTCVDANVASTAAVVWGADAPGRLRQLGVAARLVASDGTVQFVGGWPADELAGAA